MSKTIVTVCLCIIMVILLYIQYNLCQKKWQNVLQCYSADGYAECIKQCNTDKTPNISELK